MSSVDFVEISINKIGEVLNILIDVKKNSILINNQYKKIEQEKIDELFRIIRLWKNEYSNYKIIDSEKFTIKIVNKNSVDIITGSGKYPDNYTVFKNWIEEVYE